jgi:hypothetical protein
MRRKIRDWKNETLKKCDYKCDITKENNRDLEIHHLVPFRRILDEAILNLNLVSYETVGDYSEPIFIELEKEVLRLHLYYGTGVCLKKDEHSLFHKLYGNKNNTPEQYYEFKNIRLKTLEVT